MNDFVLLTEFPRKRKATSPMTFYGKMYYSFVEDSFLTLNDLMEDPNKIFCINEGEGHDSAVGKLLFAVSKIKEPEDGGGIVKQNEALFYQSIMDQNSGLEQYVRHSPQSIINILSDLKKQAIERAHAFINDEGCDAFYPMEIIYCFDEKFGIVGYEMSGAGFVINGTPDFEKYPLLINPFEEEENT